MPDKPSADQFSDDEMEQMKRYGAAQLGGAQFSDEVEKELNKLQRKREASAAKMHAAQTGSADLGPPPADVRAAQQQNALAQQAAAQGAVQAAQAQGAQKVSQTPSGPPPPIPTKMQAAPQAAPEAPPAPGPQEGPPEPEEGPPQ